MATTSDGDPPDPFNVNVTNKNAQSPTTPAAYSLKNDSVSTTFEGERRYFVIDIDDADAADDSY